GMAPCNYAAGRVASQYTNRPPRPRGVKGATAVCDSRHGSQRPPARTKFSSYQPLLSAKKTERIPTSGANRPFQVEAAPYASTRITLRQSIGCCCIVERSIMCIPYSTAEDTSCFRYAVSGE